MIFFIVNPLETPYKNDIFPPKTTPYMYKRVIVFN
jgi:hypothetical protein